MIKAEIITIGDELLIGQVIDTNSAWLGEQFNLAGIKVQRINSISDNKQAILDAFAESLNRADIVLVTGGLGPTKDDITKTTLCEFFNCGYKFDEAVNQHLEVIFSRFGRTVSDLDRKQAEVPEACQVLHNANGTAPGMWFEKEGKILVSMPGVPYEMKGLMTDEVLPRLKNFFETEAIFHKTILTMGIGESYLSEQIADWEDALPKNMKLAYLPSPGYVRLRISASGPNLDLLKADVLTQAEKLQTLIPTYIYGFEQDTLPKLIGKRLLELNKTLATAESCTGGNIAAQIISMPGSSAYFLGGIVAYANEVKKMELGVKSETLEAFGAVSSQTVSEMALGALMKFNSDYAISISGIAGPDGGTPDKPVGTVWIAIALKNGITSTQKFQLGQNRERNIQIATLYALNMLRKVLN